MDLGANELTTFRKVTFPLILPGVAGGGAARVQPVDRRLRDHQLHGRRDRDVPDVHLRPGADRHPAAGQRHRHDHLPDRGRPGRCSRRWSRAGGRCAIRGRVARMHAVDATVRSRRWSIPRRRPADDRVPAARPRRRARRLEPDHEPRRRPRRGVVADHPRRHGATSTTRRGSASPTPVMPIRASRRRSRRRRPSSSTASRTSCTTSPACACTSGSSTSCRAARGRRSCRTRAPRRSRPRSSSRGSRPGGRRSSPSATATTAGRPRRWR